jgi:hypothetical protein
MAEFEELEDESARIQYLRDRGIQIEIPGERNKVGGSSDKKKSALVTVVRIPCDDSKAYEEMTVDFDMGHGGDQLMEGLRPFFSSSSTSTFNMEALQKTLKEQYGNQDVEVSESALQGASELGGVENFPIDHPHPENKMNGVKIYLDEASQLKNLPVNQRAAALAAACGFKDVPFSGDVYVGRTRMQTNGVINNVDFKLGDMDTATEAGVWIKGAEHRNYEHNSQLGKIDMSGSSREPGEGENKSLGFTWTETKETIDLLYSLPDSVPDLVKPSKQISVNFNTKRLAVSTIIDSKVILELVLYDGVDVDCCTWTGSGRTLDISLEKIDQKLWGRVEKE